VLIDLIFTFMNKINKFLRFIEIYDFQFAPLKELLEN
jgi:hypothetical protein